MAISVENRQFFLPSVYLTPPAEGDTLLIGYRREGSEETRMMGVVLPDSRNSFKIGLAVLIQYRRVTQTATQPR